MQKGLVSFFGVTFIVSWLLWLPGLLGMAGVAGLSSSFLTQAGTFVPSLAGLVWIGLGQGWLGLKTVLRRACKFRFSLGWYALIFLLMPAITFIAYIICRYVLGLDVESVLLPMLTPQPLVIIPILLYMLAVNGPLGEEFGWRGYALEKMMSQGNFLKVNLLLGSIWAIWHLPLFFIDTTIQGALFAAGGVLALCGYTLYTILLSVLITLVYLATQRSLASVLLLHTTANLAHGLFTVVVIPAGSGIVLFLLAIATYVLLNRNRQLLGQSDTKAA